MYWSFCIAWAGESQLCLKRGGGTVSVLSFSIKFTCTYILKSLNHGTSQIVWLFLCFGLPLQYELKSLNYKIVLIYFYIRGLQQVRNCPCSRTTPIHALKIPRQYTASSLSVWRQNISQAENMISTRPYMQFSWRSAIRRYEFMPLIISTECT